MLASDYLFLIRGGDVRETAGVILLSLGFQRSRRSGVGDGSIEGVVPGFDSSASCSHRLDRTDDIALRKRRPLTMTPRPRWPLWRHAPSSEGASPALGRSAVGRLAILVALCSIALARPAAAQSAGTLSGRVVDRQTGRPILGVLVTVPSVGARGLTNGDGFFVLLEIPAGGRELVFEHLSYGRHTRQVSVEADNDLVLEARLSQRAIELAPLVVEALSALERRRVTTGFAMNEIGREEIELAQRTGQTLSELLRDRLPGAMIRAGQRGSACLENRGFRSGGASCNTVTVILDGVQISDPGFLYVTMPLGDIERIELLSAGQAGARYGSSGASGVLMIETRQGPRPSSPPSERRSIAGFDWSAEAQPYAWKRVFAVSFVASAIGVGTSLFLANRCLSVTGAGSLGLRTHCNGGATAGVALLSLSLPTAGGSLAARWGGRTDRSEGEIAVSAISAILMLTSGYLFLIRGGDVRETAGMILLFLGVPTVTTLADRAFRSLR